MSTRACRDCGEEYRPEAEVTTCSDCGGPIEWREEPAAGSAAAASPVPDEPHRMIFRADSASEMGRAAKLLGQAALPFSVRPAAGGGGAAFELWVPLTHTKETRATLASLLGPPTEPEEADPAAPYGRCPACDAEVPSGVQDCPECGLSVGALDAPLCPGCGAPYDPDAACPSCGR